MDLTLSTAAFDPLEPRRDYRPAGPVKVEVEVEAIFLAASSPSVRGMWGPNRHPGARPSFQAAVQVQVQVRVEDVIYVQPSQAARLMPAPALSSNAGSTCEGYDDFINNSAWAPVSPSPGGYEDGGVAVEEELGVNSGPTTLVRDSLFSRTYRFDGKSVSRSKGGATGLSLRSCPFRRG
jgi:hypothetical protein